MGNRVWFVGVMLSLFVDLLSMMFNLNNNDLDLFGRWLFRTGLVLSVLIEAWEVVLS